MEIIEVAAGVVRRADGRVLICRRTGRLEGLWEFPGGKLESGETPAQCLERELMEELELPVTAGETLGEVKREEGGRMIRLIFVAAEFAQPRRFPCMCTAKPCGRCRRSWTGMRFVRGMRHF